jgi:hypothetical protein
VLELAPASRWATWPLVTGEAYASMLAGAFLSSPLDFLLTAFLVGGLVAVAFFAITTGSPRARRRRPVDTVPALALYGMEQILAGATAAIVLLVHTALLRDTVAQSTLDLLRLSLPPWNGATIALQVGLVAAHGAAFGIIVLLLLAVSTRWRLRRRWYGHVFTTGCWVLPLVAWNGLTHRDAGEQMPQLAALAAAIAIARFARPIRARYRHGSQGFRMILLALGLVVPAVAFYPTMFHLAWQAKSRLIEARYAPLALSQRTTVQAQLQESPRADRSDPGPRGSRRAPERPAAASTPPQTAAFQIWQATSLATYPVTSSVEVYGREGALVSRFAFNLPETLSARRAPRSARATGTWPRRCRPSSPRSAASARRTRAVRRADLRRRSSGRSSCTRCSTTRTCPFTSSRLPTCRSSRRPDPLRTAGQSGEDVEYAVYGWSRSPLYSSRGHAWPLDDAGLRAGRAVARPVWAASGAARSPSTSTC